MAGTERAAVPLWERNAMRVGDLDGMNTVYGLTAVRSENGRVTDFSGNIILEPEERLLAFETEVMPDVLSVGRKKDRFYERMLPASDGTLIRYRPEAGWGNMYFTDRRVLFLRRPDLAQLEEVYGQSDGGPVIPEEVRWRASSIIREGGMEYLEVRLKDVTGYDRMPRSVVIRFSAFKDIEYCIKVSKGPFEKIRPTLDGLGVKVGRRSPLRDTSLFLTAGPALALMLILGGMLLENDTLSVVATMFTIFYVIIVLFVLAKSPRVSSAKKRRWYSERTSLAVARILLGGACLFALLGALVYFLGGPAAAVFGLVILVAATLVGSYAALWDFRRWEAEHENIPYTYKCPTCGKPRNRKDIACDSCGSVVWWVASKVVKRGKNRWMRRPLVVRA